MSDPNAKTKQRQMLILGAAAVGILGLVGAGMFLFDNQAQGAPREKPKTVSLTPPGTVDDKDAWRANEAARGKANEANITEIQNKLRRQEEQNQKLSKELAELKIDKAAASSASSQKGMNAEKASEVLNKPLPVQANAMRVLAPPNSSPTAGKTGQPPVASLNMPINGTAGQVPQRDAVEMITFGTPGAGQSGTGTAASGSQNQELLGLPADERAKRPASSKEKDDKRTGIDFIPAGSFVRVAMLNGVDAPTGGQAQGNPLPVAFHVLDTANLANKYKLNIKDCRFVAAAWGDLSSERTMARTETLTCIIDNETVEMSVKGQAMGEDGKAGIRGRLVTKQGQLLANALFAGSLSGIGKAFQAAATTTTTGGGGVTQSIDSDKVTQAAIGGGVSSAANMLAQYYLKAADKLYPVIETDGGRIVEILITKGAVYNGKARVREQHRGLLKRHGFTSRSNDDD
jgi:conjugal transfer pilus assembly protein TraB